MILSLFRLRISVFSTRHFSFYSFLDDSTGFSFYHQLFSHNFCCWFFIISSLYQSTQNLSEMHSSYFLLLPRYIVYYYVTEFYLFNYSWMIYFHFILFVRLFLFLRCVRCIFFLHIFLLL